MVGSFLNFFCPRQLMGRAGAAAGRACSTPTLELVGGIVHVVLFVVSMAVLIALGKRSTPEFVFKTVTHDLSGWENPGIAWGLGLLTCTFSVVGGFNGFKTFHRYLMAYDY